MLPAAAPRQATLWPCLGCGHPSQELRLCTVVRVSPRDGVDLTAAGGDWRPAPGLRVRVVAMGRITVSVDTFTMPRTRASGRRTAPSRTETARRA